MIKVFFTELYI